MSLGFVALVLGVGLADSINPVPFTVAVLLAARSLRAATVFAVSGFVVTLVAGLVLIAGPGTALHEAIREIRPRHVHIGQVIGGVTAIAVGLGIAIHQIRRHGRDEPTETARFAERSPLGLGVGIALVDIPTALPYLGIIVAIIGASGNLASRALLVLLYNVCYALPVFAVVIVRGIAGRRAHEPLQIIRRFLERWAPRVFSLAAVAIGTFMLVRGLRGL